MKRREFITLLGGAAAWPVAAQAQQKLPIIGFLGATEPSAWSKEVTAFVQRLHELGWVEGRTVAIERRWGEGHNDRYAEIAGEFEEQWRPEQLLIFAETIMHFPKPAVCSRDFGAFRRWFGIRMHLVQRKMAKREA